MIYQENNTYKFFLFKANYLDKIDIYVIDKSQFEKDLLTQLQMDENNKAMLENRQPITVNLPTITYIDITHTQIETDRLAECQNTNGQLDDVIYYVTNGSFPNENHSLTYLENKKIKNDLINMQDAINILLEL